jgi:hypothetical protein
MSKHTPGPWRYMSGTHSVYASENKAVAQIYGPRKSANPERDANARLIAASPCLLAAAETARAALSELLMTRDPVVYADALRALDSAIAKATGEAQ